MQVPGGNLTSGPSMESSTADSCKSAYGHIDDADYEINENYKPPVGKVNTPKTVFVEVLVAVDKYLIEKIGKIWVNGIVHPDAQTMKRSNSELEEEVKLYIRKFMSAVDVKFQGHFSNPRIKFAISGIAANPELDLPFFYKDITTYTIPPVTDRNTLDIWKTKYEMYKYLEHWQNYQVSRAYQPRIYSYDVILALSGREKFQSISTPKGTHNGLFGLSGLRGACSKDELNTIVLHDLGTFNGVKTAAHHFGHMLGASHDGEKLSASCCRSDGYIMSDAIFNKNNVKNLFKNQNNASSWSPCSKYLINEFVSTAECLFNHPEQDLYPLFSWHELSENIGSMKFRFEQCGGDSDCNPDPTTGIQLEYNICQYLQCQKQDKCLVQERTYAMEGTYCSLLDLKKRCFQGECYEGNKLAVPRIYDVNIKNNGCIMAVVRAPSKLPESRQKKQYSLLF